MSTVNDDILRMYGNPASIQHKVINGLEKAYGGGNVITTPNNVVSHLVESFAGISSGISTDMYSLIDTLFPHRVQTMEGLFKHMSDFDYVGLYGIPCSTFVEFSVFLESVIENSEIVVDEDIQEPLYRKVIIPRYTEFDIDGTVFSLYNSIDIRVDLQENASHGRVTVLYSDTDHPLHDKTTNYIENAVHLDAASGADVLSIRLPVYQFKISSHINEVYGTAGFKQQIAFDDKFYAARVFSNIYATVEEVPPGLRYIRGANGIVWVELTQVLDSNIYDVSPNVAPTVVVQPDTTNNTVTFTIPPVFTNEGFLGNKVLVQIYKTEGELELVLDSVMGNSIPTTFAIPEFAEEAKYCKLLYKPENILVYPHVSRIVGGANGIDFEELRERVIYSTSDNTVMVSPDELVNLYRASGFDITKFKDGITNRIYLASKDMRIDNDTVIPSGNIVTTVKEADTLPNGDGYIKPGILYFSEVGSFTLTPDAVYKYDGANNRCLPVHNIGDNPGVTLSNSELVRELNEGSYTISPFYTSLITRNGTALATIYDLDSPTAHSLQYHPSAGDSNLVEQMFITACALIHNPIDNEFILRAYFTISGSEDTMDTVSGQLVVPGVGSPTLTFVNEATTPDGEYLEFKIPTTYRFGTDGTLELASNIGSAMALAALDSVVTLTCYATKDATNLVSTYQVNLKFAELLDDLFSMVNLAVDSQEMVTYSDYVFATYDEDVYERDENGNLVFTSVAGVITFNKLHSRGDLIFVDRESVHINMSNYRLFIGSLDLDNLGKGELTDTNYDTWLDSVNGEYDIRHVGVLHFKDDPILDPTVGIPTYQSRVVLYNVSMVHLSRNIAYLSQIADGANTDFIKLLREGIISYCNTVGGTSNRLLQNTEIYFTPKRTMGLVQAHTNTSYTQMHDLEIKVSLRLHVPRSVLLDSEERTYLRDGIISIIDRHTKHRIFSLTEVCKEILDTYATSVGSVDILGISDVQGIQTLSPVDSGISFGLGHVLQLDDNNKIVSTRNLTLEFVATDLL